METLFQFFLCAQNVSISKFPLCSKFLNFTINHKFFFLIWCNTALSIVWDLVHQNLSRIEWENAISSIVSKKKKKRTKLFLLFFLVLFTWVLLQTHKKRSRLLVDVSWNPNKGANTSILQVFQIEAHYFFFQLKFYPIAGEKFGKKWTTDTLGK